MQRHDALGHAVLDGMRDDIGRTGMDGHPRQEPGRSPLLLFEDCLTQARVMVNRCAKLGIAALHRPDASRAGDCLMRWRPRMVMSDLLMPGGGGWAVLEAVAAADPDTPVMILSHAGPQELARVRVWGQLLGLRALHVEPKPISTDCLRDFLALARTSATMPQL